MEAFHNTYHGHEIGYLKLLCDEGRRQNLPITWLAGDSSLDNKYWVKYRTRSIPHQLYPISEASIARTKRDVAYWMNDGDINRVTINAAIEESTLAERDKQLLPHDAFLRDNVEKNDDVIVSVGCNDIAYRPTWLTIAAVASLIFTPKWMLKRGHGFGFGYLKRIFKAKTERFVQGLIGKTKPRRVLICMIYYPDENAAIRSWANKTLERCLYDIDPEKMQIIIKHIYETATQQIQIPNVKVVPVPLFEVLDGKCTSDYTERVEPSESGGFKMAKHFKMLLDKD